MQDLVNETHSWNLGSSRKLLEALEHFSGSIQKKSLHMLDEVDNLNSDALELECNFRNTFNEFLSLADTQFIENVRAIATANPFPGNLQAFINVARNIAGIKSYMIAFKTSQKVF